MQEPLIWTYKDIQQNSTGAAPKPGAEASFMEEDGFVEQADGWTAVRSSRRQAGRRAPAGVQPSSQPGSAPSSDLPQERTTGTQQSAAGPPLHVGLHAGSFTAQRAAQNQAMPQWNGRSSSPVKVPNCSSSCAKEDSLCL